MVIGCYLRQSDVVTDCGLQSDVVTKFGASGTIYGVYDVTALLQSGGVNAVGVYAGAGWYGMWGYGGPCFRLILSVTIDGKTTMVGGSDPTWTFTRGPVVENSEYNGKSNTAALSSFPPPPAPPFLSFISLVPS